jgi:hypothetical protein
MDIEVNTDNHNKEEEADYIDKVAEDYARFGSTSRPCPRCGNKLLFEDYGSANIIKCERENCIKVTFRGL